MLKLKKQSKKIRIEGVEGLYENFDTKEGQKYICRIAAVRDRAAKDLGQMRKIKKY